MILCEKIKIDSAGRIYIPVDMREAAELEPGDAYILCNEETHVITIVNKKNYKGALTSQQAVLSYPPGVKEIGQNPKIIAGVNFDKKLESVFPGPDYKTMWEEDWDSK